MAKKHSFTEYVESRFYNPIFENLEAFIEDYEDRINFQLKKVRTIGETELLEFDVKFVDVNDAPKMRIDFDVLVQAQIKVSDAVYNKDECEVSTPWFLIQCSGDIDNNLDDFEIKHVEEYVNRNHKPRKMSDALVPIIKENQMDEIAEAFLREYYPKALVQPCYADTDEIVRKMGLTMKIVHITKDGSIFGRCYFKDSDAELYDPQEDKPYKKRIDAGTILVDQEVAFLQSFGAHNNTVIHECLHWWLHRKAFALANLYEETLSSVGCKVGGGILGLDSESMYWMEWQANKLASRIQMPEKMFKEAVDRTMADMRRKFGEYDQIDIIEEVIDQLLLVFKVTRTAVKHRMVELGYDVARGTFNFVDGHYIRPYKTKMTGLPEDVTFSIASTDFAILSVTNKKLMEVLATGRYQFAENHVVLMNDRYLEYDETGSFRLTHYARNHIEECCIAFTLEVKDEIRKEYVNEYFLNRDEASPIIFVTKFTGGLEKSGDQARRDKLLEETLRREKELMNSLKGDYVELLNIAQGWYNSYVDEENNKAGRRVRDRATIKEIIKRTGLGERTVGGAFTGDRTPSIETLVLICLALHLPYDASMKIIASSPNGLDSRNSDHDWYRFVLKNMYGHTVSDVKDFLTTKGIAI